VKSVILAGGRGTRLAPYTKILPKPLMPIGDMPILEILLRQMKQVGVDEVILTVGHLAGLLRAFFQDGDQLDLKIKYSYEDQPLGTAGPLSLVRNDLDSTFFVANGDVLTDLDLNSFLKFHKESGAIASIAMHVREVKIDLGVLQFNGKYELTGYIEKPTYKFHVSMGVYIFEPEVLKYIPYNEYLDFPNLITKLMEHGRCVVGYPFEGYWQDLGRADDYEQAVLDFEKIKLNILGDS